VAPNGADGGTCTAELPCQTFAYAYSTAAPGQAVVVAGGRYPPQSIPALPGRAGRAAVVVRPASGGRVVVAGELDVFGSEVEVRDMQVRGWYVHPGASGVTLRDVESVGGMFITSADHVSVLGGSVGPGNDYSPEIKAAAGSSRPPRDIVIDGVLFHDWRRTNGVSHVDCLHVMAVDGLVLRRSRFRDCEAFDVLLSVYGTAGAPRNVVVEGNDLGCCRSGYFSLMLAGRPGAPFRNVRVLDNRAARGFAIQPGSTTATSRIRFHGNVAPTFSSANCGMPGVVWDHNVWGRGRPCSAQDRVDASAAR
jgi:hypothetical protein